MPAYSTSECMVARAARELREGEVVFVGIGLPNMACNLARRTHAPNLMLIYESGAVGAAPDRLPVSIGDPCLVKGALSVCSIAEVHQFYLQGGRIDVGFLGAAQMDRYGNINTTVIGDYKAPRVRLPGSGGACEIATHAKRVVVTTTQRKRKFPDQVDFITSPGHFSKGKDRRAWGLPGGGPGILITDLGVYTFAPPTGEMTLVERHPNVTLEDICENLGWEVRVAPDLVETRPPTPEELRIIREELDPDHIYL